MGGLRGLTLTLDRAWLTALIVLLLASGGAGRAASPPGGQEYDLKAAFLRRVAMFVEWPSTCFATPQAPLLIGVLGKDPFGPRLEMVLSNKTVQGRSIEFRRFANVDEAVQARCHILFIAPSEKPRLESTLDTLKTVPMLTVGDTVDYGEKGVMINLMIVSANLRFDIDLGRTSAAGLKISSQVLDLASKVRGRPKLGE